MRPDARRPGMGGPAVYRSILAEDAVPGKGTPSCEARTADPARAQLAAHRLRDTARRLTPDERREIAEVVDRLGREVSTARVVLGASWALAYAAAFDDLDVDERLRAVS